LLIYTYWIMIFVPLFFITFDSGNGDSLVNVEIRFGLGNWGPIPGREIFFFLFTTVSLPPVRSSQPPIHRVPGSLSPGLKQPGRESGNSRPSSADVRNPCSNVSPPLCVLMAWFLFDHFDKSPVWKVPLCFRTSVS
jgi:hypothetical protein